MKRKLRIVTSGGGAFLPLVLFTKELKFAIIVT